MRIADPFDRSSLEVRILAYLNDRGHPITFIELAEGLADISREGILCKLDHFREEGLVTMRKLQDGNLVGLTAEGKSILLGIYTGRGSCS
jgi:predicted ArsR family transcriptional regulator